jgi:hypothetical protein
LQYCFLSFHPPKLISLIRFFFHQNACSLHPWATAAYSPTTLSSEGSSPFQSPSPLLFHHVPPTPLMMMTVASVGSSSHDSCISKQLRSLKWRVVDIGCRRNRLWGRSTHDRHSVTNWWLQKVAFDQSSSTRHPPQLPCWNLLI